jgi:hypothetical protein
MIPARSGAIETPDHASSNESAGVGEPIAWATWPKRLVTPEREASTGSALETD